MTSNASKWRDSVLSYWFGELSKADWFTVNNDIDHDITARFYDVYNAAANQDPVPSFETSQDALALIILLDQFPRNMFRGTPKAFATDAVALAISQNAVEARLDDDLGVLERQFLYMPHMHAEDARIQARCVELFARLDDENAVSFAIRHQEIIDRFGRFPHRNAILGRRSTAEETAFLNEPNSSF